MDVSRPFFWTAIVTRPLWRFFHRRRRLGDFCHELFRLVGGNRKHMQRIVESIFDVIPEYLFDDFNLVRRERLTGIFGSVVQGPDFS